MQLVSLYNPVVSQYRSSNKTSFTGVESKAVNESTEIFSEKSKQLVKKLDQVFEEQLATIRKKRLRTAVPGVSTTTRRGSEIIAQPMTFIDDNIFMLKIKTKEYEEKFLFDKRNLEHFRYEKHVPTQYGSAVVRSMDYHRESDINVSKKLNETIETYFPLFVRKKSL